jgi:hypothetical protein
VQLREHHMREHRHTTMAVIVPCSIEPDAVAQYCVMALGNGSYDVAQQTLKALQDAVDIAHVDSQLAQQPCERCSAHVGPYAHKFIKREGQQRWSAQLICPSCSTLDPPACMPGTEIQLVRCWNDV